MKIKPESKEDIDVIFDEKHRERTQRALDDAKKYLTPESKEEPKVIKTLKGWVGKKPKESWEDRVDDFNISFRGYDIRGDEEIKDLIRSEKKKSFEEGQLLASNVCSKLYRKLKKQDRENIYSQAKEEMQKNIIKWAENNKKADIYVQVDNQIYNQALDDLINFLNKTK